MKSLAKEFFRVLFLILLENTRGNIELRGFDKDSERPLARLMTRNLEAIESWIDVNFEKGNLYVGISTRKLGAKQGRKEDCYEIPGYWADLDFKDFPDGEAGARKVLNSFPKKPTIIVETGHGLHLYWIFKEVEILDGDFGIHESRMKGIATALNGDSVSDISRVLRIPGTLNFPTEKKRRMGRREIAQSRILEVNKDLRYNPDDFDDFVSAYESNELLTKSSAVISISKTLPERFLTELKTDKYLSELWAGTRKIMRKGTDKIDRSRMDYALARRLFKKGYAEEEIASVLSNYSMGKAHERSDPAKYVGYILNGLYSQEDRKPLAPVQKAATVGLMRFTTLQDFMSEPEEEMNWIVDGLLSKGGMSLMVAKPKLGKSTLARQFALAIARGEKVLGRTTRSGTVIMLLLEERKHDVRQHFRRMGADGMENIKVFVGLPPANAIQQVQEAIMKEKPAMLIVDTLSRLVKVKDLNDYAQTTSALEPLLGLARESGTHVMLVHHAKKGGDTSIDSVLGSTALSGTVDTIIFLNQKDRYRTVTSTQRLGEGIPESVLEFDQERLCSTLGEVPEDDEIERMQESILEFLVDQNEPLTEIQIDEGVTGKRSYRKKALRALVNENKICRTGLGKAGSPYLYQTLEQEPDEMK